MTKGTRYFMIGSALIVALGIGTGLVAYYNGDLGLLTSRVGPDELVYVPADATALAYANVREIMNSEFRQKLRQVLPTGEGKDELFNQTGIDVEHDIDSVLGASIGAAGPKGNAMALIRGRFDEGRIENLIRQHGGVISDYGGKRMMAFEANGSGANGPSLVFVETGLAMIGDQATLRKALDARAAKQNITDNSEMMKLVSDLNSHGNTAWAVGNFDAVANNPDLPMELKDHIRAVEWFAASVHVNGGVNGHLRAETRDDQAAADLRAVVNGAIAAARLVGGHDPKVDAMVNSLQMTGTGKHVDLAFTVPPAMLDVLNGVSGLKNMQQHHAPKPQPQEK
jgi:hypothetical protein